MTNREEVAKKLREIGEEMDDVEDCYETEFEEIDTIIYNGGYENVFQRLADLLDPTCRIVYIDESWSSPDVGHIDEWHYGCSRCRYELNDGEMDEFEGGALPFSYCPNCGARVVNGVPNEEAQSW